MCGIARFEVLTVVVHGLRTAGTWRCVTGYKVLQVSKDYAAFIFRAKQSGLLDSAHEGTTPSTQ